MKKVFLLLSISFLFITFSATAQQKELFYGRLGGNLFFTGSNNSELFFFPAISFAPGLRIVQSKDFALVVAVPVSIGSSIRSTNSSYLGIDAPATLEFNFGSAAGNNEKSHFGLMLGAGAGYHYAGNYVDTYNEPFTEFKHLDFWGYRVESGISFGKGENGSHLMVLFNYGRGFTSDKRTVIGVGLVFTMGTPPTP